MCSLLMGSVVFVQVEHPNVTVINRVKRGTGSLPQHSVWSANHFCGGDFTQLSGILRSPGFPLYYPNNKVNSTSLFQMSNFCPKNQFFLSLFLMYVYEFLRQNWNILDFRARILICKKKMNFWTKLIF